MIPEILQLHGKWLGAKPAIVTADKTWSWREFDAVTNRVARGLRALGVDTGDRVGVVMTNSAEAVAAIFGALKGGAVAVPINLSVNDGAVEAMLRDAGVRVVFASEDQSQRIEALRASLTALLPDGLICAVHEGQAPDAWQTFDKWIARQADAPLDIDVPRAGPCNIIYSSGTTGLPKGIEHTHERRIDWAYDLALALRYDSGARTLATLGLYSNISWVMMLCTFVAGGTVVLQKGFDARAAVEAIARERISHTAMVPIQWQRLLDTPEFGRSDLSSMRAMMSCGSPLAASVKEQLFRAFPCGVIELYGLTEGVITTLDPEDAPDRFASVGKPIAGSDIRILGTDDRDVKPGGVGEIVGRSRFTMPGYWNRPEATADATWIDERGRPWLRTGDIGRVDEEGFLYIVDRKKDMILSGGQNIYPADIEVVLATHDAVAECAVIGVPDDTWGETPLAIVVRRTGARIPAVELRDWLNQRVGRQQRVCAVEFRSALPRNPNGKILKRELREGSARG